MYATQCIDGLFSMEDNAQKLLHLCGHNWEFADWLCTLLNELSGRSLLMLNECDVAWLKAVDDLMEGQVHNA